MNFLIRTNIYRLAFFIVVSFITSCTGPTEKWHPIPLQSSLVIEINSNSLTKKILLDKWEDFNFTDLFDLTKKDGVEEKNILIKILKSPGDAGIDLSENIYLFKSDSVLGVCLSLDDYDKFQNIISQPSVTDVVINKYHIVNIDSFTIVWNKKRSMLLYKQHSLISNKDLNTILALDKTNSIFSNNQFTSSLSPSDDISVWLNNPSLFFDNSYIPKEIFNDHSCAYINFDKGKINLTAMQIFTPLYQNLFVVEPANNFNSKFSLTDSSYLSSGIIRVNLTKLLDLVNLPNDSTFKSLHLTRSDLTNNFTGNIAYNLSDLAYQEKKFTTYSYDDDFNKIEKTKTIQQLNPNFRIWMETKDSLRVKNLLDNLVKLDIINDKQTSYSFDLTARPFYIFNKKNNLILSDKDFSYPNKSFKQLADSNYTSCYLTFNFNKLSRSLSKDNQYKNLTAQFINGSVFLDKGRNKDIQLHGEIVLKDKENNSLLTLLKTIKEQEKPR
jgi:hypothetical protein